ncbi:hypothetical protein OK18_02055 [Chryseobacterium gallinarum]|uniref:Phage head morphogenesis domain-containing protein n=1 Tax=Chryseobacterium gallinarum TaxID=1324352 RepID=A0A0G3LYB1_CHRGL|nr:DUF935 family protein [Chryseobacterium gallinarum]AKK71584.1 hypothetical protein OK18_02055 [Chryseobacterium gallinarum]
MKFKIQAVSDFLHNAFVGGKDKDYERAVTQMVDAIKRQRTFYNKEIRDWKIARATALDPIMPRRKMLIDIMEEVLDDPFIYGRSETRKLRVSNKSVAIVDKDGEINEEKTKLLQKLWFKNLIKYTLDSIYFSYTLMYPKELDENGFIKNLSFVYRDHIVPETTEILIYPYDLQGENFRDGDLKKWMLWVNHEHSIGLLNKAIPLWIFKKHSWQNWDEFEEMFGIPMRTAKVASTDPRVKKEVDKWLKDLGSAGWARFPEGVEIDIKESNSRDSFNVFNEKRKACNEELANLFDGNSETAKDTGSRAKTGEIINGTQKLITMDDETFVMFFINDDVLPWLRGLGYPFEETDTCIWNDNEKLTPKERLEIFKGVKDLGYKIKKEQIETELDVEIVGEVSGGEPPQPIPQNRRTNFNTPHNHFSGCEAEMEHPANVRDITPQEENFLRQLYENPGTINWSYNEFKASHTPLLEAIKQGFGKMDFDFDSTDHRRMRAWMNNIHRFGVDKTQAEVYELNEMLKDPEVKSFNDFRNKAKSVFPNYKELYLRTEWDHANATSNMAARYLEMMDDVEIAPYWRLNAIIDDGTTVICRSLDGKVFDKRDQNSWKFLPPLHWKCRTDAEDIFDDYDGEITSFDGAKEIDPDGWERMQKQGFDVNWGDSDQVFTQAQSYLKKLPQDAMPINVDDLGITDYGLSEWAKVKKNSYPEKAVTIKSHIDKTGMARIITSENLPVWIDAKASKLDDQLFTQIRETLMKPDEVYWSDSSKVPQSVFIRFYKDGAFKVTTESVKVTDFELIADADTIRKGLLVNTTKK